MPARPPEGTRAAQHESRSHLIAHGPHAPAPSSSSGAVRSANETEASPSSQSELRARGSGLSGVAMRHEGASSRRRRAGPAIPTASRFIGTTVAPSCATRASTVFALLDMVSQRVSRFDAGLLSAP
jgi:hypothetical protein